MKKQSAVDKLNALGYLEYNKTISSDELYEILSIKIPIGRVDKSEMSEYTFSVLSKVSNLRAELLEQNMFLNAERGAYRILNPREHIDKADKYYQKGIREFNKSKEVLVNTDITQLTKEELQKRDRKRDIVERAINQTKRLGLELYALKEIS